MDDLFNDDGAHQHRDPPLDVTSRAFQPKRYIQRVLAGVPHAVFEGELVDRVGKAEEDTGEALKQLIRDNLSVFINSKDAMDAVFHSDQALFTGEALDGITDSFKGATSSCEALVQPITASFVDVQKSRKSQDMLDKLFSVLGVPGAVYECCGARVAMRRQFVLGGMDNNDDSSDDEDASEEKNSEDEDDDGEGNNARMLSKNSRNSNTSARRARRPGSLYDDDDGDFMDEDEEDDEDGESDDEGLDGIEGGRLQNGDGATAAGAAAGAQSTAAHGTLENPGGSTDPADVYVLEPSEEIYFWYGTPLVRLIDVDDRRHHVEEVSNYEAAVLHLRRAMLYIEETYSLHDGSMLAGDGSGSGGDGGRHTPTPQPSTAGAGAGGGTSSPPPPSSAGAAAHPALQSSMALSSAPTTMLTSSTTRSTFAYEFSMALLRASLYLCSQLAEELVFANPADTVLIEDTLSMMMDASIATVKLRHLCKILKEVVNAQKRQRPSLTKLRTQLNSNMNGGGDAAGNARGNSVYLDPSPLGAPPSSPGASLGLPSSTSAKGDPQLDQMSPPISTRRRTPVYQHPVQYFISIVQKQHRHMFQSSAAGLLQEANGWMWKAQTDAARGLEERHRQRELQRKLRAAAANGIETGDDAAAAAALGASANANMFGGQTFANSFFGGSVAAEGGFIGNSNDSFMQDTSFHWTNRPGRGDISSPTGPTDGSISSPQGLGGSYSGTRSGVAGQTSGGGPQQHQQQSYASFIPESFVPRVLDAFNTPESPLPTTTELKVGTASMEAVLVASCLQVRMHAVSLLSQLFTRADVESAVMAQATALNTFALRLCAECVGTLEHVVGSYWGGIATTLHAGVFDFVSDTALQGMLEELLTTNQTASGGAGSAGGGARGGGEGGQTIMRTSSMGANDGSEGLQRSPSSMLSGGGAAHSRSSSFGGLGGGAGAEMNHSSSAAAATTDAASTTYTGSGGAGGGGAASVSDPLPRVRFVPTLPQNILQPPPTTASSTATTTAASRGASGGATQTSPLPQPPRCLREISVQAVQQMISSASNTLQALFLAFINKGVVDGFVGAMARYRVSDVARHSRSERIELHAAVLYEVLLGQWERMMNLVGDSVLRLKIVMGESSSSTNIHSDGQVEEVGNLLQELESLRSSCLRCYLHGVGVLSKAYLTMLPLLQRRTDAALDARVRARLSRDSVSSNTVHKLLNVLSVVVDRCVPFFTRDAEVFDSVDLFAVKAENLREEEEDGVHSMERGDGAGGNRFGWGRGAGGRRVRIMRNRRGSAGSAAGGGGSGHYPSGGDAMMRGRRGGGNDAAGPAGATADGVDTTADPISELLATFHSKLVMESLQDHEELVLALLSHLLLAFVDMLQLKCRNTTTDLTLHPDERERNVVECMADTLCLATTLTPILMEHLLSPCFFELIARQLPEVASSANDIAAYAQNKQQQYAQVYLTVVEEHCQLAVDAMMNTYLALAQQPITDLVRRQGFVQPLFDWQRVSPHTTAAVRPYIADAIACIARAHEALNSIRQPILGSAATQRLIAHFVRVFLTAITSDVNVFELSVECSSSFLVLGLTLLEAEAQTILNVVDSVITHAAANPTTSEMSPELLTMKESLRSATQMLDSFSNAVCESISAARNKEGASAAAMSLSVLSRDKRHARRDAMVQAAMRTLAYMVEAINTELEESSLSSASLLQMRSSATEGIVQRLERRNEGYELRRAKAAQKEQERKELERRQTTAAAGSAALSKRKKSVTVVDAPTEEAGNGARKRVVRRRPDGSKPLLPPGSAGATAEDESDDGDHPQNSAGAPVLTPRTVQAQEKEAASALAAANDVLQIAQGQQHKRKVVRKGRKSVTDGAAGQSQMTTMDLPRPVAVAPSTAAAANTTTNSAPAVTATAKPDDDDGEDEEGHARVRASRRARRGGGAAATAGDAREGEEEAGGAMAHRERRANRFRRSNAL